MKISVIIPHRNDTAGLIGLLDTIPPSKDLEVIVVDDCSDDGVVKKLSDEERFSGVRFQFLESPRSAGGARNEGLALATGEWILFADSDDTFLPGAFEIVRRQIDRHPGVVMIHFRRHATPVGGEEFTRWRLRRLRQHETRFRRISGSRRRANRYRFNSFVPWSIAFRRSFVQETGVQFQEVKWGNDVWFVGKLCERAGDRFSIVDEAVYSYSARQHDSLSSCRSDEAELTRILQYAALWKSQDRSVRSHSKRKKLRMWLRAHRIGSEKMRQVAIAHLSDAGVHREIFLRSFFWKVRHRLFPPGAQGVLRWRDRV